MSWYAKKCCAEGGQALVIDANGGRNVAVAYDEKDAALLAAAPELYEAAREVLDNWESGDLAAAVRRLQAAVDSAEEG